MIEQVAAICWPHDGTVGCMTVASNMIHGHFPATAGPDAIVCCDLLPAGKYRNGAARAWCRTHQQYWGVKSDLAALAQDGRRQCARHAEPMHYARDPVVLDPTRFRHIALALNRHAGIDVNAVPVDLDQPAIHQTLPALALTCAPADSPFASAAIAFINITPAALQAFELATLSGLQTGCIDCARCGHPHLDLGDFANKEHKRHYCGNCGNDSTHSPLPLISNPLFPLLDFHAERLRIDNSNVHR